MDDLSGGESLASEYLGSCSTGDEAGASTARLASTLQHDILAALDADELVLPTLPEVALKVREAAEGDCVNVTTLTTVIGNDASLSARILRVANSPLYRASAPIQQLDMAVMRLGIDNTANLATGLAMQQLFQATSDMVDEYMRATWSRSTEIAGICNVLCRHYTQLRPAQATLAGLIHNIGVLPVLTYIEDNDLVLERSMLDALIARVHAEIGSRILARWEFPPELQVVPKEHLNFSRRVEQTDYADVVMVAHLHSSVGLDGDQACVDWGGISAFGRIGLDHQVEITEVAGLAEDFEAAAAAF